MKAKKFLRGSTKKKRKKNRNSVQIMQSNIFKRNISNIACFLNFIEKYTTNTIKNILNSKTALLNLLAVKSTYVVLMYIAYTFVIFTNNLTPCTNKTQIIYNLPSWHGKSTIISNLKKCNYFKRAIFKKWFFVQNLIDLIIKCFTLFQKIFKYCIH